MPTISKLNSKENRDIIISIFPKLMNDTKFKIDSPLNPDYNCIAWAGKRDTINWWPVKADYQRLDGVSWKWPFGIIRDTTIQSFISLFEHIGYNQHPSTSAYDPVLMKIALYAEKDPTCKIPLMERVTTHAARQLRCGLWTSKLGDKWDIIHSDPYDLESDAYGDLVYIMGQKFN